MKKFISINPRCVCHGYFKTIAIHIDLEDCSYVFLCKCNKCGKENTWIFDIDEFIELSKLSEKLALIRPVNLLGEDSKN